MYNKEHIPSKQRFFRHRLVAQLFLDNTNNYSEVNHIDHNKDNCNVTNLEWVSREQNELDSRIYGSKEYKPYCVTYDDNSKENFDSKNQLAKKIGVTPTQIGHWLHKRSFSFKKYNISSIEWINV